MKLIGSKVENEYRDQLIRSRESLFRDKDKYGLLSILKKSFPDIKSAYILDLIPEQSENIYKILVDTNIVVKIEVSHLNTDVVPIIKTLSVNQYKKGLKKNEQIKLEVAIDLLKKAISIECN